MYVNDKNIVNNSQSVINYIIGKNLTRNFAILNFLKYYYPVNYYY